MEELLNTEKQETQEEDFDKVCSRIATEIMYNVQSLISSVSYNLEALQKMFEKSGRNEIEDFSNDIKQNILSQCFEFQENLLDWSKYFSGMKKETKQEDSVNQGDVDEQ